MEENIQQGDYVMYNGQFGYGIAEIKGFIENFRPRLQINILKDDKVITCDYSDVKSFTTDAKHLLATGFVASTNVNGLFTHPNGLTIASMSHVSGPPQSATLTIVPYAAGDFSALQHTAAKYRTEDNQFNFDEYGKDFKIVYYLKDLYTVLDEHGIAYNKLELAQL